MSKTYKINGRIYEADEVLVKEMMEEWGISRANATRGYFEDIGIVEPGSKTEIVEVIPPKTKRNYAKAPKEKSTVKRERKPDEDKREIIELISDAILSNFSEEINIINPEREFEFFVKNKKYKITLSCPRK